jgi:hypothetical protein
VLAICTVVTLSMAACTGSDGQSTSAPAAASSSAADSPSPSTAASPSPSAPVTTPPGPGGPGSVNPPPVGDPTKGPIDPENPQDPRVGLTLSGKVHTAGGCVFLDTASGRWLLGGAPTSLHDGANVTVRGRRIAPPKMCAANQAIIVTQVS